ncbi:C45 family peptidase [Geomicrobium sp. JCM 19037]|uniref:C45 family autoproteolytic acyltransferase/hydolase n=1 Tax=Geomicrobium sp. JCM 19037 TaxID=1460634 RepID=UPI0021016577|nr:C45 family peptidase [Geomicrobium sp. JCM 19037]
MVGTKGLMKKGYGFSLHFVNKTDAQGFLATMIVRIVLDTCMNVTEAVACIEQLPHAWCYNFAIRDEAGERAILEASPEKVYVRSDDRCTNHFHTMTQKNRTILGSSIQRYNAMDQLEHLSLKQVMKSFIEEESPWFSKEYDEYFGTLHTFAYDFEQKNIYFSIPGEKTPFQLNWPTWVQGERLTISELIGELPGFRESRGK